MPPENLDYFSALRTEILPLVPAGVGRVLDVGCGTGITSWTLKQKGLCEHATGLEIDPRAAAEARLRLDSVYECDLGNGIPSEARNFDLVLALDVFEHLVDPWAVLKDLGSRVNSGGHILISLPNVRNFRVIFPLLVRGRWQYQDFGLLDRTHLRFFTRHSAIELVKSAQLDVEKISATGGKGGPLGLLRCLSLGMLNSFIDFQYLILARKI